MTIFKKNIFFYINKTIVEIEYQITFKLYLFAFKIFNRILIYNFILNI